jgi:hypothetical protein
MAKHRSPLTSRTSRGALPPSDAPVWEVISPGVRLGYRRGRGTNGPRGNLACGLPRPEWNAPPIEAGTL